jgi:hypothetical protein
MGSNAHVKQAGMAKTARPTSMIALEQIAGTDNATTL